MIFYTIPLVSLSLKSYPSHTNPNSILFPTSTTRSIPFTPDMTDAPSSSCPPPSTPSHCRPEPISSYPQSHTHRTSPNSPGTPESPGPGARFPPSQSSCPSFSPHAYPLPRQPPYSSSSACPHTAPAETHTALTPHSRAAPRTVPSPAPSCPLCIPLHQSHTKNTYPQRQSSRAREETLTI